MPTNEVWHVLRVRTAEGEEWEPAAPFIRSLPLAIKAAKVLADFLHGMPAAQANAPQWAIDISNAIRDDGRDPARCSVEVNRGRPGRWKRVAKFAPAATETGATGHHSISPAKPAEGVPMRRLIPFVLLALTLTGCSNKGGREGKVTAEVGKNLQALGVPLVDWRYSPSKHTFGIKLKATNPVPKSTFITLNGPGLSNVMSLVPSGDRINAGEWIDFGGSNALGNPIEHFPDEGTITIDTR